MQEIYLDPQLETMPPPISSSSSGGGGGSSSRHNREIITTQRRDRNTNHPMDAILDDKFQISYRSAAIATYSEVVAIILLYGIAIYYFMVGFQFFGGGRIGGTSYFMNEILIVYRIIGGLLLGQSFSCSVLVSPIIQDLLDVRRKATTATRTTTNRNPIILLRKLSIHTSRACAVTTSITGLFLVVICLFEFYYTNSNGNQNNEMITDGMIEISETTSGYYEQSSHNNNNKISSHRISLQLLIYIGTGLIIFSCLSLMASFWPLLDEMDETQILLLQANSDASTATSTRRRRQQRSEPVVDDILSSDLQEPLLRDDHNYEMQQPNLNPVMISNCQNGDVAMQIDDDATVGISGPTGHNIETGIEENEDVAAILAEADAAAIELERSLLSHESMQMDDSEVGGDDDTLEQESSSRLRGTRRLLQLASTEVRYLYVGCAVLLVRLPFSLAMPHFVSTTLSALALNEFRKAREEISWLLLIGTIDAILDFWCVFLFGYANQRIVRELRLDLFNRLIRQEVAFFDKNGSGELTSRLNSDCSTMASDLTWFFRFSIESVVRITGIAAYMCIRCPTLGGCTLLIVPVIAIINKFYGDWLKDNAIAVQDSIAEVNSIAQETLSNIRTVLSFAAEDYESKRYQMKVQRMYRLNIRQLYITGVYYMGT